MLIRNEYPRPQFVRENWLCLNGEWQYETDRERTGFARQLWLQPDFHETICVPFCRESRLSGIGDTDFCNCVWYRKEVDLSKLDAKGRRVLLHFGACDYQTTVWINGQKAGEHIGGYASFSFEITPYLQDGKQVITVCAEDDLCSRLQPCGKQSRQLESHGCFYTRTTGIWQTVWIETVPEQYIRQIKFYPLPEEGAVEAEIIAENAAGADISVCISFAGKAMGTAKGKIPFRSCRLRIDLAETHLWELGQGNLYDVSVSLGEDRVSSYFGLRSVSVRDGILLLNGKPVFQRLVLDQGYYPDGIYTAPDDNALKQDVAYAMRMGFNGARLHQKVFEERFLYHCDRMGYLVWGEFPDWGLDLTSPTAYRGILPEWLEVLNRDFNHPALIGWCPLNETNQRQDAALVRLLADLTRTVDPTRLYLETSGWAHIADLGDLLDFHFYEQDPEKIREKLSPLVRREAILLDSPYTKATCTGIPTFISECGGIRWATEKKGSWGYGEDPQSEEAFFERFGGILAAIMENPVIGGFCYTQLYDVEQEKNGLCTYDRQMKFDPEKIRRLVARPAAIETTEAENSSREKTGERH